MIIFLFIISILRHIKGGFIHKLDFNADYLNVNQVKNYTIGFWLETQTCDNCYLKLELPAQLTGISSVLPQIVYTVNNSTTEFPCTILQPNSQTEYFIQFFNLNKASKVNLFPFNKYFLKISVSSSPNNQDTHYKIVKLSTVTSTLSNSLILDSNPYFSILKFIPAISGSLSCQESISSPLITKIQMNYEVNYKIGFPKSGLLTKLELYSSTPDFKFTGVCSTLDGKQICSIDTQNNRLIINLNDYITNGTVISIKFNLQNPSKNGKKGGLYTIWSYKYASSIIASCQSIDIFQTTGLSLSSSMLSLAWGLSLTSEVSAKNNVKIIRGDQATPTIFVFNNILLQFTLAENTPMSEKLELEFNLKTSGNAAIQVGSIYHNLPNYPLSTVKCSITGSSTLTNDNKLICKDVGEMAATKPFNIQFRMFLSYDASQTDLPLEFSSLTIYTVTSSSRDLNPLLSSTSLISSPIKTLNNQNYHLSNYENTVVTSLNNTVSGVTKPNVAGGILGIQPFTNQKMLFGLNIPQATLSSASFVTDNVVTSGSGIEIVFNPSIKMSSTPILEGTGTSTEIAKATVKVEFNTELNKVKVFSSTTFSLNNLFTGGNDNWISLKDVNITSMNNINSGSSEQIFDFYFFVYQNMELTTPQLQAVFFTNAYSIITPKPFSVKYSIVNWHATAASGNDGNYVPTMLRISGYFQDSQLNQGKNKIAIFFDNLEPFYSNSDTFNNTAACSWTFSNYTCLGYSSPILNKGQDYPNYARIELYLNGNTILTGSENSFQLLIPVKVIQNVAKYNIFLGFMSDLNPGEKIFSTMKAVYRLTGDSNLLTTSKLIDFGSFPSSLVNSYKLSTISTISFSMDMTNTQIGKVNSQTTINPTFTQTSTLISANSNSPENTQNGGGFTFNCQWNFEFKTSFSWAGELTDPSNKCQTFNYNKDRASDWRYGIFCPLDSNSLANNLIITNFAFPYTYGLTLASLTSFAYSKKQGDIAALYYYAPTVSKVNDLNLKFVSNFQLNIIQASMNYILVLPNDISNSYIFEITFDLSIPFTVGNVCIISTSNTDYSCSFTSISSIKFSFTITCSTCPKSGDEITISHFNNNGPSTETSRGVTMQVKTNSNILFAQNASPYLINFFTSKLENVFSLNSIELTSYNKNEFLEARIIINKELRPWLINEYLEIDFGNLKSTIDFSLITCNCLNKSKATNEITPAYYLSTITIDSGNKVVLVKALQNIFSKDYLLLINCSNLKFPSSVTNTQIQIKTKSSQDIQIELSINSTINATANITLPIASTVQLTKLPNVQGLKSSFSFSFSLNTSLSNGALIIIEFPRYYIIQMNITRNFLQCRINNISTGCFFSNSYQLYAYGNLINMTNGSQILVDIENILIPSIVSPGVFIIKLIDSSGNQIGYVESSDIISKDQDFQYIIIESLNSTNPFLGQIGDITIQLSNIKPSILKSANIIFNIPTLSKISYNCIISDGQNNLLSSNCNYVNGNLEANIDVLYFNGSLLSSFNNTENLSIKLQFFNVFNSDTLENIQDSISIELRSRITNSFDYQITNPSLINRRFESYFGKNETKNILKWNFNFNNPIKNSFYTGELTISTESGIFTGPLIGSLSTQDISFDPKIFNITPGSRNITLQIGADAQLLPGIYNLEFLKLNDPYDLYSYIPPLSLKVSSERLSLATSSKIIQVPLNGESLPFTISSKKPISLSFGINLALNGTNFSLSRNNIIFNSSKYIYTLIITAKPNSTLSANDTITFSYANSTNNPINLPISIPISYTNLISDSIPVLNIISKTISSNSISIQTNCSDNTLFGQIISNSQFDSLDTIITNSQNFITTANPSIYSLDTTLFFGALESEMNYSILIFCRNQFQRNSISQQINFKTQSNNGIVNQLFTSFETSQLVSSLIPIICRLNIFFSANYNQIMTKERVKCIESDFYNVSSLNFGQNVKNLTLYFTPDYNSPSDQLSQKFIFATNSSNFTNTIKSLFLEFKIATNFISWTINITEYLPVIDVTSLVRIIQSGSKLIVKGLKLQNPGFIYFGVDSLDNTLLISNTSNSTVNSRFLQGLTLTTSQQISFKQIREGINNIGKKLKFGNYIFNYNGTEPIIEIPIPVNNSISKESILIHYAGSSENPQTNSKYTPVETYSFEWIHGSSSILLKSMFIIISFIIALH